MICAVEPGLGQGGPHRVCVLVVIVGVAVRVGCNLGRKGGGEE